MKLNLISITLSGLLTLSLALSAAGQPANPQAPDGLDFEKRSAWMLELFRGKKIRGHQKTGIPDAFARLAVTDGNDAEALEYLSKYPVKSDEYFDYPWLARALHMYGDKFSDEQMARLKQNLTNVRDWLGHGTENHAAMRVASAYLVAQYFPDHTWRVGGRELTSVQMMAEAKQKLIARGKGFYRIGNNEQLSPSYALLNAYPLLGLYDFAEDPEVRDLADALVTYHVATVAVNNFDGHLMPPHNRRSQQMRFSPQDLRAWRFTPIHHTMAWLLWGQNRVYANDLTSAGEPPFAVFFATTTWRCPDVVTRIAQGAGTPYELRSGLSGFNEWGKARHVETKRYVYRHPRYAIGSPIAQRFNPRQFFIDYDMFSIAWESEHRYRVIEASHLYWYSNKGEDHRRELHSPFQQCAAYKNTAIVMFNIPQADPWATVGDERYWANQRSEHIENLIKLGTVRFPATVQELTTRDDAYYFRDGDVFVGIRVLKPGHELDKTSTEDFFTIKSREAQTGFVIEMSTEQEHGSFEAFMDAVQKNELSVDWSTLTATYRNTAGDELQMQYDPDIAPDDGEIILLAPKVSINGEPLDLDAWPVFESPVVNLNGSVLTVEQGGDRLVVDWSGELPRFER